MQVTHKPQSTDANYLYALEKFYALRSPHRIMLAQSPSYAKIAIIAEHGHDPARCVRILEHFEYVEDCYSRAANRARRLFSEALSCVYENENELNLSLREALERFLTHEDLVDEELERLLDFSETKEMLLTSIDILEVQFLSKFERR